MTLKSQLQYLKRNVPEFINPTKVTHEMCLKLMNDNLDIISKLISKSFLPEYQIKKMALKFNGNFDAASEIDETITILYYHLLEGVIDECITKSEEEDEFESASNLQKFSQLI